MRGFIINIRKAKNEDVVVTVLTNNSVKSYWRFFGARHSILQIGNLIDFEEEDSTNNFMPKMRKLSHLSFPWIFNPNHLLIWQNFIKLFEAHLNETTNIDNFYFDLLLNAAQKWHKQNPKRLAVESYTKLLAYEGRLYDSGFCYICEEILDEKIGLMRAYLPAHPNCIYAHHLDKKSIFTLFNTYSTIHLDNSDVQELYNVLLKGL
ncbi:recombination protein RecO [bacterium]|nr:recombination protein RecO [bacterium]MBU1958147.1 recombination protein RecO [bacterium]